MIVEVVTNGGFHKLSRPFGLAQDGLPSPGGRGGVLLVVLTISMLMAMSSLAQADDVSTIRERLVSSLLPTSHEDVQSLETFASALSTQLDNSGTWSDIDWKDETRNYWQARKHLDRLLVLAKVYAIKRRDAHYDTSLAARTVQVLRYWVNADPTNPNWWWNEIGVPQLIGETTLLMGSDCPADLREQVVKIMQRSVWTKWTGQNLVWGVENQIMRALITNDDALVKNAYQRLYDEIKITSGDGIQSDYSFHQHGDQLYSGGYGLNFAQDVGRYICFAAGTRWQPPAEKMRIYADFMLKGERWMTWGDIFDYNAVGREIVRKGKAAVSREWKHGPVDPSGAPYSLAATVGLLSEIPLSDIPIEGRPQFTRWYHDLMGRKLGAEEHLVGTQHYFRSDYSVHRDWEWMISLKMHSKRTINTEVVNGEGLLSTHLGDGNYFIYRSGNEYRDIFPLWDWEKLPGTTAEQGAKLPVSERGHTDFVGGMSNGIIGVSAMDLQRGELVAKKSWFFLNNQMICLGAGIGCNSNNQVVTTVEQCWLNGKVDAKTGEITHDGLTYRGEGLQPLVSSRTGSWQLISKSVSDEKVRGDVFEITIDHGSHPIDKTYCYTIFPADIHPKDFKVICNNSAGQAIVSGDTFMAVFYKSGRIGDVVAKQPCIMMLTQRGMLLYACDPTQKLSKLEFEVGGKAVGIYFGKTDLPGATVFAEVH